jgi:hypothetical protein
MTAAWYAVFNHGGHEDDEPRSSRKIEDHKENSLFVVFAFFAVLVVRGE